MPSDKQDTRRNLIRAAAVTVAASTAAQAQSQSKPEKVVHRRNAAGAKAKQAPLFSGAVSYGNLLFIAGKGAHFEGDIMAHTKHVLVRAAQLE